MIEVWKDITGYEGYYQVSNMGRVKSLARKVARIGHGGFRSVREKILPAYFDNNGYQIVFLSKNGERRTLKMHRLVAFAFIPYNPATNEVNHIDGCKSNNKVTNLEWVTPSQNIRHADKKGLRVCASGASNGLSIQIRDNETGEVYQTIKDAAFSAGVTRKIFSRYLRQGNRFQKL
jgi:hypothetical protein